MNTIQQKKRMELNKERLMLINNKVNIINLYF